MLGFLALLVVALITTCRQEKDSVLKDDEISCGHTETAVLTNVSTTVFRLSEYWS